MTSTDLLNHHLSFVGREATSQEANSVYHPSVVAEFPYAPPGHTRRLEGIPAVVGFLARIGTFAHDIKLLPPTTFETSSGLVAEYHGESIFNESGRKYDQDYVVVLTVEEGLIIHIKEYYDPLRVLRSMGEID